MSNVPERSEGPASEILLYQTEDKKAQIEVRLEGETVWLNQSQMTELFQTTKQNISLHIRNVFSEGELQEESVVKEYLTTAADGKRYSTQHYNLDVIISVGYRVKSHRGTQFRIWATQRLREFLVKGFKYAYLTFEERKNYKWRPTKKFVGAHIFTLAWHRKSDGPLEPSGPRENWKAFVAFLRKEIAGPKQEHQTGTQLDIANI